jgi:HlyD family secretion protein
MAPATMNDELSRLRIDKTRKRPGRRVPWLWMALGLAALAGGGWYWRGHAAIAVTVTRAERVEAVAAAPAGAALLTASGYVIPRHSVEVSSKIVGRVKDMPVSRGDLVKAGDVLIRMEDEEQQAQLRMAQARLAAATARVAEMRAGSRPQAVQAARAATASAQATLDKDTQELQRMEALHRERVVSIQELDRARSAFKVSQAALDSARENQRLIETWPRHEQLDAALAEQHEAEANVAYAHTQLDNTVIVAPIDGAILEKVAEKGELVTNINFGGDRGAKSSVVTMADLKDLQIELDVNEDELPKIHRDQDCEIRVDSAPGQTFKGRVDEIAPQADRQKGTVQVKVRLIEPGDAVLPEVSARVTFLATAAPAAAAQAEQAGQAPVPAARIFIPRAALADGTEGQHVYIAAEGTAVRRAVTAGPEEARGVEILEGLAGNETLITAPLDKIRDGARIAAPSDAGK